eukprot:7391858-Prymnesium_polylepis.2
MASSSAQEVCPVLHLAGISCAAPAPLPTPLAPCYRPSAGAAACSAAAGSHPGLSGTCGMSISAAVDGASSSAADGCSGFASTYECVTAASRRRRSGRACGAGPHSWPCARRDAARRSTFSAASV